MQYNGENLERCDKQFVRKNNKEKKIPKQYATTRKFKNQIFPGVLNRPPSR